MAPAPGSNPSSGGSGGASAVDIITYIGIPLAVLGVIPTLYTCLKSLLTLRDIRRLLAYSHVSAITRSSLLSGIIEVEIPRKSLCPLDRNDPSYFKLGNTTSVLKGGSWTQLNWRELTIGVKSYRLQYHDELCQPQAEVDFESLVAFLLDLGAVPHPQGFEDLRSSGLWTPAGTKLMLAPEHNGSDEAVLFVTTSEDSDGILSLGVYWRADWGMRRVEDLPPYWMRLCPLIGIQGVEMDDVKTEVLRAETEETLHDNEDVKRNSLLIPVMDAKSPQHKRSSSGRSSLSAVESHKRSVSMVSFRPDLPSAIRLRLGTSGLAYATYETLQGKRINLPHLQNSPHAPTSPSATWFAAAATSLGASYSSLWAYTVPSPIQSLSQRESVPGGVLVLLSLLPEDAVPSWREPHDDKMAEHERWVAGQKQMKRQMERLRMTPEERSKAFHKDFMDDNYDRIETLRRQEVEAERKKEQDVREALVSQRVGIAMVSGCCLKWLVEESKVLEGADVSDVVEKVLWDMIGSTEIASDIAKMLELWKEWAEGGGMTKTHFEMVKKEKLMFAYAACVLCLIKETAGSAAGSVVSDLQDCLRMWRKVRLG